MYLRFGSANELLYHRLRRRQARVSVPDLRSDFHAVQHCRQSREFS